MRPFRDRNPVVIGLVGFAVIAAMLVAAFRADRLPLIGGGDTYYAEFAEAGGLRPGNEVRVAGVSVGKVTGIELDGDTVRVEMLIDTDADLGRDTRAKIQVRTLLGAMYVALEPAGPGELTEAIPVSRTEAPYDVVEAFSDLSRTTGAIDQEQLASALDEIATLSQTIPEEFGEALNGLSRVSTTLSARDSEITALLQGLERAMAVLNDKDEQLETIFTDADSLFRAVADRRDSIRTLLLGTQTLSRELTALIDDNEEQLRPILEQLDEITDMLVRIESSLDETFRLAGPFARVFANNLGVGPWFTSNLNLEPAQLEEILRQIGGL